MFQDYYIELIQSTEVCFDMTSVRKCLFSFLKKKEVTGSPNRPLCSRVLSLMESNSFIWWIDNLICTNLEENNRLKYAVVLYMQVISKSSSKQTGPLFSAVTFYKY